MTPEDFRRTMDAVLAEFQRALRQGEIDAMLVLVACRQEDGGIEFEVQYGATSAEDYEELCDAVAHVEERMRTNDEADAEYEMPTLH